MQHKDSGSPRRHQQNVSAARLTVFCNFIKCISERWMLSIFLICPCLSSAESIRTALSGKWTFPVDGLGDVMVLCFGTFDAK